MRIDLDVNEAEIILELLKKSEHTFLASRFYNALKKQESRSKAANIKSKRESYPNITDGYNKAPVISNKSEGKQ